VVAQALPRRLLTRGNAGKSEALKYFGPGDHVRGAPIHNPRRNEEVLDNYRLRTAHIKIRRGIHRCFPYYNYI